MLKKGIEFYNDGKFVWGLPFHSTKRGMSPEIPVDRNGFKKVELIKSSLRLSVKVRVSASSVIIDRFYGMNGALKCNGSEVEHINGSVMFL